MRHPAPIPIRKPEESDLPREGRPFRMVLEAVQNGLEQLGEQCSKSEFDFKKPDDVDMDCPTQIFCEKLDLGAEIANNGSFEDRLADRLGLTKPETETNQE